MSSRVQWNSERDSLERHFKLCCHYHKHNNSSVRIPTLKNGSKCARELPSDQWQIQGVQQVQIHPLSKNGKKCFKSILKVFGPLPCFCVCHTTENDLVFCTRWKWASTNPFAIISLHKNTPLHLLWHFKVTQIELSSDYIRVILPMHVRGQLLILWLLWLRWE